MVPLLKYSSQTQAPIRGGHQGIVCTLNTVVTRNSEIRRRLFESNYSFKKSNKHETQQFCNVDRPISLNSGFDICLVTTSNTLKYCYNVVFLFHCFLTITVVCLPKIKRLYKRNIVHL